MKKNFISLSISITFLILLCSIFFFKFIHTSENNISNNVIKAMEKRSLNIEAITKKYTDELSNHYNKWKIYLKKNQVLNKKLPRKYKTDKSGILTSPNSKASNIYLRKDIKLSKDVLFAINSSNILEQYWKKTESILPYKSWKYFIHSKSGLFRVAPWIRMKDSFGHSLDFRKFPIYSKIYANGTTNGTIKCIKPSVDYGGLGITSGCCINIYKNKEHYGIIGLDIPISSLFQKILNSPIVPGRTFEAIGYIDGSIFLHNNMTTKNDDVWHPVLEQKSLLYLKNFKLNRFKLLKANETLTINDGSFDIFITKIANLDWFFISVLSK